MSNLESYPNLELNEVTLSRAEFNTGIVLDENEVRAVSKGQKVFTVCKNEVEGIRLAVSIVTAKPEIECWINNAENSVLHYINRVSVKDYK